MPHQYQCHQCRSVAPRRDRREDAETDMEQHRATAHGGLEPADGDTVDHVHAGARGDGLMPDGSAIAAVILLLLLLGKCVGS